MVAEQPKNAAIRRQVAINTVTNYVGRVLNLGVWFVLTPIIFDHLGTAEFGLWALVANFVAYGSLADLGIAQAVVKYIAEYRAKGDSETASQLVATALWLYTAAAVLVVIVGIVLAPIVPHLLAGVQPDQRSTTSWLIVITALGVAVQLPATAALAALRGLNRFDILNLIGALAILTLAASTVIVLLLGGKVIAITFLVVPLTLFWLVPTVWAVHRIAPDLRFGYRGARRSMARQVTIFGSALFGIQVAQVVKLNSDELVIGAVKSVKAVAPYNVAARLSNIPSALTNQFIYVLLPIASRLHAEGEEWLLREVYLSGIRLTIALFSIVGIPVIVFASPFLSSWISPTVASSGGIAVTLTVAGLLEAVMAPASQALQGMNRHRPLVIFALGSAALNLGLSLALIGPLGVRGVAFGTLIATSLQALVTLPFAGRVVGVSLAQVARKVLLPGLLPVIPAAAVLVLLRHTLAPASVLTIALAGGAGAVVYIGCYLLMPASASERAMANQLVGRVRRLLAH